MATAAEMKKAREERARQEAEVRLLSEDPVLHNRLYLVRNCVPFDIAFSLDSIEAQAWAMHFGRMDGHEWDWAAGKWTEKK